MFAFPQARGSFRAFSAHKRAEIARKKSFRPRRTEKQKKKYDAEEEACSTFCSTFGFEKWNTHFSYSSASSNDSRKSRSTFVFEPKRSPSRLHRLPRENHLSMFHLFHFFSESLYINNDIGGRELFPILVYKKVEHMEQLLLLPDE